MLPPKIDNQTAIPIAARNIYNVLLNSSGQVMAEGEITENLTALRQSIKTFVLNNGHDSESSDNPRKAVVSLKAGRGAQYNDYIQVLNAIQGAYYDIYASQAEVDNATFRKLDRSNPVSRKLYEKGREGIPMNISIVVPND